MTRPIVFLLLLLGLRASTALGQSPTPDVRDAILAAEDRRAPDRASLEVLTGALNASDPAIQRLAVRALGRLERPSLVATLAPMLGASDATVRAEAANAIAQAVSATPTAAADPAPSKSDPVATAQSLLIAQMERESNLDVRGVICESLGRLPYRNAVQVHAAEKLLVTAISFGVPDHPTPPVAAAMPTLSRALKGVESLLRQNAKLFTPSADTVETLNLLAASADTVTPLAATAPTRYVALDLDPTGHDDTARVAQLALLALAPHSAAKARTLASALDSRSWELRRVAVRVAAAQLRTADAETRSQLLAVVMRGLGDTEWRVRYESLSAFGRTYAAPDCRVLLTALADPSPHVSLLAVDVAPRCGPASDAPRLLGGLVRTPPADGAWQRPAHALVSLARVAPEQAAAQLPRFVASPIWQARMYAARAAAAAKAGEALRTLAADSNDNVRNAAIEGLADVEQHAADEVFLSALTRPDGQLLITAANALKGTPDGARAMPALVQALATVTKQRRDTSRDVRLALLARIAELGSREQAAAIAPYLRDFDPRVAREAASILTRWTGANHAAAPAAMASSPPPTWNQVRELEASTAIVRMKNGGSFILALLPLEAPAAVVRFTKLARSGYYNGLTFHRVEAGLLVQGGSPGANEYAGDGPFMRDELGFASNRRGSVGVSTRGRDTGDAQFYVNLVDNARYDHNYTVFACVERGMDVVDTIVEGDVIEEVRIVLSVK